MTKRGNYTRIVGALVFITLWMFSMGVSTVHHHFPEEVHQHAQHGDHDKQSHHCDHHDHTSEQDCSICALIHHTNSVGISYFAVYFALLYPASLPELAKPYILSFQQDFTLASLSLRGPPMG